MMRRITLLLLLLIGPCIIQAQSYPYAPLDYVTDMADVLDEGQEAALNKKLKAFEDSTSNQIFVYIGNSAEGRAMSELCQEIFHKWKIGEEEKDNGVLVAVFIEDHKFRIHTGYGMEGALPDILTKKIQDTEMKPHFKNNDYYTGLNNGIDKLVYYSAHEYVAPPPRKKKQKENYFFSVLMGYGMNVVFLVINIYLLYNAAKNRNKSKAARTWTLILLIILFLIPCAGSIFLFVAMFLLGIKTRAGATSSGTYTNTIDRDSSSSWSSSSDSGSGSDFSGGGGGDSGGGGSDSDW